MTKVLHKKVSSSDGIPPSLLKWDAFWFEINQTVQGWVVELFPGAAALKLKDRWVVRGELARDQMSKDVACVCDGPSGLCAVSLNDFSARSYAAVRLGDDPNQMAGVSNLLIRLVCEQPLKSLIADLDATFEPFASHFSEVLGSSMDQLPYGFEDDRPYLILAYELPLENSVTTAKILFDLARLRTYARESMHPDRSGKPSAFASANPELRKTVLNSPINLFAVIEQRMFSLAECFRMEPGQTIRLPDANPEKLKVAVETTEGLQEICEASVGTWKQHRALKLRSGVDPLFLNDLVRDERRALASDQGEIL